MSQYGIIYRMEFKNTEDFTVRINISPTDILIPDGDTPEIIPLTPSGTPLVISSSNDTEDKFTPIRSKSAKIEFVTNTALGQDSATFSQGGDDLWKVDIYLQDTPELIFTGFLMMADNQQPFQPDPQYVTLTATDHLAALKEITWTNLTGENPIGKYRVADILTFCLQKTGLLLDLFVVNNLRAGSGQFVGPVTFSSAGNYFVTDGLLTTFFYPGQVITITGTASNNGTKIVESVDNSGLITQVTLTTTITVSESPTATITDLISTGHWYDVVYIDAKTFEQEIGLSEKCYQVLEKILGEDCFITQYKGAWWIFRVDEMEGYPVYVAEFNSDGTYISTATGTQYDKNIGRNEDSKFANADTLLRFVRPHDYIKETFNYNTPLEVPCNRNFVRGDYDSGTNPKQYDIECWTAQRGLPGAYNSPITITAFIRREFNDLDYEIERYIRITPQTGHSGFSSTDDEYIESEAIPIQAQDKFNTGVQWQFESDIASSSARLRLFRLVLHGNDGSWWILGRPADTSGSDETVQWYDTVGWTQNSGRGSTPITFSAQDETEWQNIDWAAPPAPVSGYLYIWLNQAYTNSAVPSSTVIRYMNLTFDYIPYINGGYSTLNGQYSQIDRTEDGYFANRDETVFISDSPAPLLKGTMFQIYSSVATIIPRWFSAAPHGNSYPPDDSYLHPYGYIQAFSVWNQYKGYNDATTGRGIGINIFSGSVKGLTDDWPDLIHRFTLTDTNPQTDNRYFMLISLEQDWKSCIWTATLVEVYNTAIGKTHSDPFTFKYITQ